MRPHVAYIIVGMVKCRESSIVHCMGLFVNDGLSGGLHVPYSSLGMRTDFPNYPTPPLGGYYVECSRVASNWDPPSKTATCGPVLINKPVSIGPAASSAKLYKINPI